MGFGAIQSARNLGLRVPQDISIVGIDCHPFVAFKGLALDLQQLSKQRVRVANELTDFLQSGEEKDLKHFEDLTQWPIYLVVRSSTARQTA